MKIIIINGPNLNLIGRREPHIYGHDSFEDYFRELKKGFPSIDMESYQSNVEGEIINKLQECGFTYDCIILNAGGYTHTSVAIADAVRAISAPVIEVHISNIFSRESYRRKSMLSPYCAGVITGFGMLSYKLAIISCLK